MDIPINGTTEWIEQSDAVWKLRSAFLVMTMQSGFALLEAGCVSCKNVANITVKNVMDVVFGGLVYWAIGFGLSFGRPSTPFCGLGWFFLNNVTGKTIGSVYATFMFQFSFASAATTIVSGAVAERMNLHAYMIISVLNTLTYCFPASWVWNKGHGFLTVLGFYDFAGSCVVHMNGGVSSLICCSMLGPRENRFVDKNRYKMSSPVTALAGTMLLWWAWFGFNTGSVSGVTNDRWRLSSLVAVNTLMGAVGGATTGMLLSIVLAQGQVRIDWLIYSLLGGLVSVTGSCSVVAPAECIVIASIGASMAIATAPLLLALKIDDPVGAICVHFIPGLWGTLAVGLFGKDNLWSSMRGANGLFHGGGFRLLGAQVAGMTVICLWSIITTWLMTMLADKLVGIRMDLASEHRGADAVEHGLEVAPEMENIGPAAFPVFRITRSISNASAGDLLRPVTAERSVHAVTSLTDADSLHY